MPKNARVFVAEDETDWRVRINKELAAHGHTVVLAANSFRDALEKVELAKKEGINVAVIDGILYFNQTEGPEIAMRLKREVPGIKIVSFSSTSVDWGDKNLKKRNFHLLGETVSKL